MSGTPPADAPRLQRVNVIGGVASGKSTFARRLADLLQVEYIEMDALFWGKNWSWPPRGEMEARLHSAIDGQPAWVLDGHYPRTVSIKWRDVDTVIWLDTSLGRTMWRVIARTWSRLSSGRELWPDSQVQETLGRALSRRSIVWRALRTHSGRRRHIAAAMRDPAHDHIRMIRLQTPRQCERFLAELAVGQAD